MAEEWIKIVRNLEKKPEVIAIARACKKSRLEVVGLLVRFWGWMDEISVDGNNLSLTSEDVDEVVDLPGFAAAMRHEKWLAGRDGSLQIPKFERHNGSSAKARALEAEAKRLRRLSDSLSDNMSGTCPTKQTENVRPEREAERRTRGDPTVFKSDRKPIGTPSGNGHSNGSSQSPKELDVESGEPFDTSDVDWNYVIDLSQSIARVAPPASEEDRRAWMRYAVMASKVFSEDWLRDSLEAVVRAEKTKKNRRAHLVAVLQSKAAKNGMDAETFNAMAKRIEIPDEVWHTDVIEVRT